MLFGPAVWTNAAAYNPTMPDQRSKDAQTRWVLLFGKEQIGAFQDRAAAFSALRGFVSERSISSPTGLQLDVDSGESKGRLWARGEYLLKAAGVTLKRPVKAPADASNSAEELARRPRYRVGAKGSGLPETQHFDLLAALEAADELRRGSPQLRIYLAGVKGRAGNTGVLEGDALWEAVSSRSSFELWDRGMPWKRRVIYRYHGLAGAIDQLSRVSTTPVDLDRCVLVRIGPNGSLRVIAAGGSQLSLPGIRRLSDRDDGVGPYERGLVREMERANWEAALPPQPVSKPRRTRLRSAPPPLPWPVFEAAAGRELRTLLQRNSFLIQSVAPDRVVIRLGSGGTRSIHRKTIEAAWRQLHSKAELTREDLDRLEGGVGSYMAPILALIDGVEASNEPVRVALEGNLSGGWVVAPT